MKSQLKIYGIIELLRDLEKRGYDTHYILTSDYFMLTIGNDLMDAYATIRLESAEANKRVAELYIKLSKMLKGKKYTTWKGAFYPEQDVERR